MRPHYLVLYALVGCGAAAPARNPTPAVAPPPPAPAPLSSSPVRKVELPVVARWIVHEEIGATSRWLLVAGTVRRGTETDPPVDADYVVLRPVDERFAAESGLPVRTLEVPQRFILPEPFVVTLHVDSEPQGARIYEVSGDGTLVALGRAPIDLTYAGSVSDSKVSLMGTTWLASDVARSGATVGLWAATDTMTSAPDTIPTAVTLVTPDTLDALHHGTKKIAKATTLVVHTPIARSSTIAISTAVIVDGSLLDGTR